MKVFEEQFPDALDLLSRALRAGHAFQTALGMVGDELKRRSDPSSRRRSISRTSACRCATP
jgi:tight adherence protein B